MKSIVLVTNHLTPYRRKFYDDFYEACRDIGITFTVLLMTKREPKRNWDYDSLRVNYAVLMKDIHITFPINNHLNLEVNKQLEKLNPDLVLMAGSYMYLTNWLVLFKKAKRNYPVIYWNEAHFEEKRDYGFTILKVRDLIRNTIFPRFDGFWFSGSLSKKFVNYYGRKEAKNYLLPNFVDNDLYTQTRSRSKEDRITIRKNLNIPIESKIAFIPARLSKEKGIDLFLRILKECKLPNNLVFLIAGTGDYEDVIADAINNFDVDARLLGFQKQPQMLDLYSIADFFVLPSLSDPNPLTCIEALWCGLPLLVTVHVGNNPEVISEGVNGYVIDYSQKDASTLKIEQFFNANNDWLETAAKTSVSIAEHYYDPKLRIPQVLKQMKTDFA
ncbi:glycosyltransferase family 4 protein [Sphingobacterium oryzagri]|uniref:Glycosyltransferase family 4 protein n=1 Tax=Sphingobacterium oryzagri TaxID=3025669 RepID=A0ABY7WII9_9SPHI|nr:glycosyltransferase family 4 protein [Sphingobacterium sp. KACC 22765]WDF68993.1 glycosyltransferase family 4 protein [Sphingobacterium sp. KACC 22765]